MTTPNVITTPQDARAERLMNAAPDLLEACKLAFTCLQDPEMEDVIELETMLAAAISKAEGRKL